ncbi:MAG TPA: TonB family protein [Pyrinomonadaceae bacterium]|nr:TonB family protein [Pyrinomonadaceae bacterium]
MSKRTNLTMLFVLLLSPAAAYARAAAAPAQFGFSFARALAVAASDREQDGLSGPVRRVKTETAKIAVKNGKPVESARAVLETTTYDQKGNRVDNAYFLEAGGSLTGKEVYKYDERGNIVEMTLHNDDGSLLAKEVYTYEFDAVGNWVKMTTSVAIIEGGQVTFEPSEVTYRTISYYLDETMMAKMAQPSAQTPAQPAPKPSATQPQAQPAPAQQQTAAHAANSGAQLGASAQVKSQPASNDPAPRAQPRAENKVTPAAVVSLDKNVVAAANVPASVAAPVANSAAGPSVKADEGEAPARPSRSGPLKPISGGILNGKALSLPAPAYPEIARRTRAMGTVEVEVVIDTNGKVISANAVKGPALLRQSAEQAAKQAQFTPTLLSGQPVKITGIITYNFSL